MEAAEHTYIETNGINLHVVQHGPKDGKLVILLHGFPEFWYGWHKQIAYLTRQGFRVWAPDQRGYNLSDKPEKVSDYRIDHLVEDIAGLVKASGEEKVILVGHDWGGIVSWRFARTYPELIERLIILNAPHEEAMSEQVLKNPVQIFRSSYAIFFQLRGLPEKLISLSNWETAAKMLQTTSREGTFSDEDLERYREAWSKPRAMKSMINWYRANLSSLSKPEVPKQVPVPTLLIWGAGDQFLGRDLAQKSIEFCENGRLVFFEEATHWVHLEESERVNELITNFVNEEGYLEDKLVSLF